MQDPLLLLDRLKEHLETVEELKPLGFLVERNHDLNSEVGKQVKKNEGAACILSWTSGQNIDGKTKPIHFNNRASLMVFVAPAVWEHKNCLCASQMALVIANEVHTWHPNPDAPNSCRHFVEALTIDTAPDETFVVYEIQIQFPSSILYSL